MVRFVLRCLNKSFQINTEKKVEYLLIKCRQGDLEHAYRVVHWVNELASNHPNWERLMKAAFVHDLGWAGVAPTHKLTKKELVALEPQANANSDQVITNFLKEQGESEEEISQILTLVSAADKHESSNEDEAIIVDADNLSKLTIDHVSQKYKQSDWQKMLQLWQDEFPSRIKTEKGRELYPELLINLEKEINERINK